MLNLILFGPPGSGKGTQALLLKEKYGLFHVSTGDIFRRHIKEKTLLGLEVTGYIDKGKLVPDDLTFKVLVSEIEANKGVDRNGIIFDGYPRTLTQAEIMDEYFEKKKTPVTVVLSLIVSEEEVLRRILNRGKTSGRSDDNDVVIIRQRMEVYRNQTLPLADYYEKQAKYQSIRGEGRVQEIFEALCHEIDMRK